MRSSGLVRLPRMSDIRLLRSTRVRVSICGVAWMISHVTGDGKQYSLCSLWKTYRKNAACFKQFLRFFIAGG